MHDGFSPIEHSVDFVELFEVRSPEPGVVVDELRCTDNSGMDSLHTLSFVKFAAARPLKSLQIKIRTINERRE